MLPVDATFSAAWRMSCGETNWPFLDIHGAAGAPGRNQQIGLAAQKRRDLQNIRGLGRRLGLRGLVNVGEHRVTVAPQVRENPQAFLKPGPR